jgi:hypothetical protein
MANSDASEYIVEGISGATEGAGFRWAFAHPVLRFVVPHMTRPRFAIDFALPESTFKDTGPVTIRIQINGRVLAEPRFDRAGGHHWEHEVPLELLRPGEVNFVAMIPDKVWTAPEDGAKLGFVIARAGFVE